MYQCAIECCKDNSKSIESVEKCNENCSRQVITSRKYVQDEFNNWQVLRTFNLKLFRIN